MINPAPDHALLDGSAPLASADYRALFEHAPGANLVLLPNSPAYTIVAVSEAYLQATMTTQNGIIGQAFFDVFPATTEHDPTAEEVLRLRASLDRVVKTSAADILPEQKHYKRLPNGTLEERYWNVVTTPVLSEAGRLRYLIHSIDDVTDRVRQGVREQSFGHDLLVSEKRAQRLAETDLREQWHTFDTALSHTPDFIYVFNIEGRFTYVNRALLSLWQKPLTEAVGKNFFELDYPAELAARLQMQIQQVVQTKEPLRDQTPFTAPSGEIGHYEYIFVPVFAEDGLVRSVIGSTRDITELKRAEELVKEDRRRWRELLLQAPAGIALLRGPEHRFESANADYLRLLGRSAEALIGKTVLEAVPEVERQIYIDALDKVYQTGEPFVGHESLLRLDFGKSTLQDVYVKFVYLATRDVAGRIDGVFVHATDVTDMVLVRLQTEERERQFRTLAESIPNLAWMADETGHIFWYNRRWYDYTGTTFEDIQGWGWQKLHDPAMLPSVLAQWTRSIATGEPFEMVFPLRGADAKFRDFLTRVEPVKDSHGQVVRWFGSNTDITQQKKTEEELRKMNRELEEFAYVASHDLQEPLRMVNMYTELLLRRVVGDQPQAKEYAALVRQGVRRMEALIHDLLTFSQTVSKDDTPAGVADLSASLAEALDDLRSRIQETGAIVVAAPLPSVCGDTGQLAHVFQNLLSNALKYRNKDVPIKVDISAKVDGEKWIISVRDNGIGFEPQYAERIFGLFKRLHKDEYPGTGLGLAICQRIVERYGGRMWAESSLGEGSTFYFSLHRAEKE